MMETSAKALATIKAKADSLANSQLMSDEAELFSLFKDSKENLLNQMSEGKPIHEDPELALEAFKVIAQANINLMEAKRRMFDSLVKAKALFEPNEPPIPSNNVEDPLSTEAADQSTAEASSFAKAASAE